MGVYHRGYGAAFSTSMKMYHVGRSSFLPAQAGRKCCVLSSLGAFLSASAGGSSCLWMPPCRTRKVRVDQAVAGFVIKSGAAQIVFLGGFESVRGSVSELSAW